MELITELWEEYEKFFEGELTEDQNIHVVDDIVKKINNVYKKSDKLILLSLATGGGRTEALLVKKLKDEGYNTIELCVVDKIYKKNKNKLRVMQYLREPLKFVEKIHIYESYEDLYKSLKEKEKIDLVISFNYELEAATKKELTAEYYQLMKVCFKITGNEGENDVPLIIINGGKNIAFIRDEQFPTLHSLGMEILNKYYQRSLSIRHNM